MDHTLNSAAIEAGLRNPALTFAEAYENVRALIEAERNLPPGFTDDDVDVAATRTIEALDVLAAIPAPSASEAFAKVAAICTIHDTHGIEYLDAALAELGAFVTAPALPSVSGSSDAALVHAWERWKAASLAVEMTGRDNDDPAVADHYAERDLAEQAVLNGTATSISGMLVKQRFALECTTPDAWVLRALYDGDDATLIARKAELDLEGRLIVDTIQGLLAGPIATPVPDRHEWDAALAAYQMADAEREAHWNEVEGPSGEPRKKTPAQVAAESNRLADVSVAAENRLFAVPAPHVAALAVKLGLLFADGRYQIPDFNEFVLTDARRLAGMPMPAPALSSVRQAFEKWIAARITYDLADSVLQPNEDPAYFGWMEAERTLATTPPQSAEDMLFKLFPLALSEHGPNGHQGTFELVYRPAGPVDAPYLDDSTWRGLIDGMLALSPRLAEVVAMPAVRVPEIKPDMWLPDAIPLDQIEQWLGYLTDDAEAYPKLWLRMVDASALSAIVEDEAGVEALLIASRCEDPTLEHLAIERALRCHLRASGHEQAVIQQLRATGRCYVRRQAEAA